MVSLAPGGPEFTIPGRTLPLINASKSFLAAVFPFDSVEWIVVYKRDPARASPCTPPTVGPAPFLCVYFRSLEVPGLLVVLSSVQSLRLPLAVEKCVVIPGVNLKNIHNLKVESYVLFGRNF